MNGFRRTAAHVERLSKGLPRRDPIEVPETADGRNRRKLAGSRLTTGGDIFMYARVATFQSDPADVDDAIELVRNEVNSETPEGLEGATMMMLVDRESGKGLGITLFDSEEAMRRGDAALNAMSPGGSERRTSVEFYEVPVQTVRE
jgi:hypothetical protein